MPRKSRKTKKPPLSFLEPPLGGTRLQNVPEVRAALNPKSFTSNGQIHNSTDLNSWVNPQFDQSHVAVSPMRHRRRKCQSATSILDKCTQLSKKTSVCKFPPLTFQKKKRDQSHQPKHKLGKKATDLSFLSDSGNQRQESPPFNRTVNHQNAHRQDTYKKVSSSVGAKNVEDSGLSECAASPSNRLHPLEPSICEKGRCLIPTVTPSKPPSTELCTPDVSSVLTPPDVDTPEVVPEGCGWLSSDFLHSLWSQSQPSTPLHNQAPVVLVADTPEQDYGVKVTWRRRRGLMMLLKEGGHL